MDFNRSLIMEINGIDSSQKCNLKEDLNYEGKTSKKWY